MSQKPIIPIVGSVRSCTTRCLHIRTLRRHHRFLLLGRDSRVNTTLYGCLYARTVRGQLLTAVTALVGVWQSLELDGLRWHQSTEILRVKLLPFGQNALNLDALFAK
jgi:hypothetical protein